MMYDRNAKPSPDTPLTNEFQENWDSYNDPMEAIDFAQRLERDCGILALAAEEVYEIVRRIPESHRSSTETAVIDRIRAAIIQANTKTALPVTSSSSSENT